MYGSIKTGKIQFHPTLAKISFTFFYDDGPAVNTMIYLNSF